MSSDSGVLDDHGEQVGAALAKMRRERRLTGAKLAAMVGMSQPKISRIERGVGLADPRDVGALARALGADDATVRELVERAEVAQDRMTDWRPAVALAGGSRLIGDWESSAKVMRTFEPAGIPGLLQTSGYAKAILQGYARVTRTAAGGLTEVAVLEAVSARIQRQETLADRSKSFRMIITESVLGYQICPAAEMLAQISRLRDAAAQDNVEISAIAAGTRMDIPPFHGFTLFDDSLVIVDLFNTGIISRGRRDSDAYRTVFDILESHSTEIEPLLAKYQEIYLEQLRNPPEPDS